MNEKELYAYRMNDSELQKWNQFQDQILRDCQRVKVPSSFSEFMKTQTNPRGSYAHTAGYCNNAGYFYISEGDRGGIFLECISQNLEDIRWYIMELIVVHVGQELERKAREAEEKNWRYPQIFKNGKLTFKENKNWIYNAVHDSRKYWFEYAIAALAELFEADRLHPYVASRVDLMNRWFDAPHWGFCWESMCFVEISDSKEHG